MNKRTNADGMDQCFKSMFVSIDQFLVVREDLCGFVIGFPTGDSFDRFLSRCRESDDGK